MRKIDLGGGVNRVHFIGIGGVSMSGLAEILRSDGYTVSGSDEVDSDTTRHLRAAGIPVAIGNSAAHITDGIDTVVYTAAVKPDNPEFSAALARGIPTFDRAKLLGVIMSGYQNTVCVAGTHGKTSTTALVSEVCLAAGLDPTISIGGYMGDGRNFRVGNSSCFVMEACEYFNSFLQWKPRVGVILNIDDDHMDYFGSMENLEASFARFARNIQPGGTLVIYGGTRGYARIVQGLGCRALTYGMEDAGGTASDFSARAIKHDAQGRPSFEIWHDSAFYAKVNLRLIGIHQILNALAAAAVAHALGVPNTAVAEGLSAARGVRRRFEYKGAYAGAYVVDDYAHHPTEIKASLGAAKAGRAGGGRIICAFQPHTYSRTRNLLGEFSHSFYDADMVLLLPIFASREQDPGDISSEDLARRLNANGVDALYCSGFDEAVEKLAGLLSPGDLFITMGAGDVYRVGERLLRTGLSTLSTG